MSLTFTSAQYIIVNIVEKMLLLVKRFLGDSIVDIAVTSDEPRAKTIFDKEFSFAHEFLVKLGRVLCH